jgi:hypothetical protein
MVIFYVLLCGSIYLASCDFVMDPKKEQRVCIIFCTDFGKSATETLAMIRQTLGKKAWAVHGKSKIHRGQKR